MAEGLIALIMLNYISAIQIVCICQKTMTAKIVGLYEKSVVYQMNAGKIVAADGVFVLFVGECSMADKRGTGAVFEYIWL